MQLVRLGCNMDQLTEMCTLLSQHLPDTRSSDLLELVLEFDLGDFVATPGAGGTDEVVCTPKFGARFESLLAALRAGNPSDIAHAASLAFR
jgi:hypothetical protein